MWFKENMIKSRMRWNSYSRWESIIRKDKKVELWRMGMKWAPHDFIVMYWRWQGQVGLTISCLFREKIIWCFFTILSVPTTHSLHYHHFNPLLSSPSNQSSTFIILPSSPLSHINIRLMDSYSTDRKRKINHVTWLTVKFDPLTSIGSDPLDRQTRSTRSGSDPIVIKRYNTTNKHKKIIFFISFIVSKNVIAVLFL